MEAADARGKWESVKGLPADIISESRPAGWRRGLRCETSFESIYMQDQWRDRRKGPLLNNQPC